jgi:hypothetical protein
VCRAEFCVCRAEFWSCDHQQTLNSARHGLNSARHGPNSARHGLNSVRHGLNSVRHGLNSARHGPNSARHGPNSARHGLNSVSRPGQRPRRPPRWSPCSPRLAERDVDLRGAARGTNVRSYAHIGRPRRATQRGVRSPGGASPRLGQRGGEAKRLPDLGRPLRPDGPPASAGSYPQRLPDPARRARSTGRTTTEIRRKHGVGTERVSVLPTFLAEPRSGSGWDFRSFGRVGQARVRAARRPNGALTGRRGTPVGALNTRRVPPLASVVDP